MSALLARALILAVLVVSVALAQQGRGTISGTITDASGAVVPEVSVVVLNTGTNAAFTTSTNEVGYYVAPALPVGAYTVTGEKQGFKKAVRSGIVLQVDQRAEVNLRLEVGATAESIEVVAEAPLVDTGSATVGKVVENRRINDLPLNGRNVLALMLLTPGVKSQAGPTNSGFADRGIALSAVSINGGPSALNGYIVDGGNNNNSYLADLNVNPTVDAVQEFKVESSAMSAEFGFTAGGVINIVTKSGSNEFHGSLYHFVRNDHFDARRAFTAIKEPFRYNQFGGAVGGPVVAPKIYNGRDRSFFFFNYEEWRYRRYLNNIITMPTEAFRRGDFSELRDVNGNLIPLFDPSTTRANPAGAGFVRDRFAGNVLPPARLDPVSVNMLRFYPTPNRPPSNPFTNANNWIGQVSERRDMRQWTLKGDHRFSPTNALSLRYIYYKHFNDNGYFAPYPDPNARNRLDDYENRNAVLTDTHTFSPRLLNEFRVSVSRQYFPFRAYSFGQDWPRKLGLPDSVPSLTLPRVNNGLPAFGAFSVGLRGNLTWQFFEMATLIRGNHTLKIGADLRLQRANNFQREVPSGSFDFAGGLTGNPQAQAGTGSAFATFLLGSVSSASLTFYGGESEHAYSTSFFVQDDWKVTRRLHLNLGLRHDYQQWGVERHNGTSNFDPFGRNPENGLLGRMTYASIDYGRSPFEPIRTAFGPRIGFAYDVGGDGHTVVRGGYAIYYPQTFYRDFFGNVAGFANTTTSYNPPGGNTNLPAFQFRNGFPGPAVQPLGARLGPSAFLGLGVNWDQPREKVPMSQQWSLSVQRQLRGRWVVEAAYSANQASHLVSGGYDFNQLDPQHLVLGLGLQNQVPNPYAGRVPGSLGAATISRSQSLRPYPYYTGVGVRLPHLGNSIYHAFLLSVEKRLAHGVALLASYTNGKLISDSVVTPINFGPVEQVGVVGYQNGKFNRRAERSLDPTDVSQRLVVSGVFELPFGKGKRWGGSSAAANQLIGGWQLNLITTVQTGLPVVLRGASNFLADRPNSTGKSAKLDQRTADRWFDPAQFVNPPNYTYGNLGRVLPDVRTPGTLNFDLSLIKDTHLTEQLKLQFRAEAFNFPNHPNLGAPNASFAPGPDGLNRSSTLGTITSARDPRILQFGLKLIF
jgi:hypothetical protein